MVRSGTQLGAIIYSLAWVGPIVWLLFVASATVAVYRTGIGRRWRRWHLLTYPSLLLGTAHALVAGANFDWMPRFAIWITLGLVTVLLLAGRRLRTRTRRG